MYFPYSAFWLTGQWGGYSPRLPHGYATAGTALYYGKSGPIKALRSQKG